MIGVESRRMKSLSLATRVVLYICLAAVLLAALTNPDVLQPIALVAPLLLFLGTIVTPPIRRCEEPRALPLFPILQLFSPRPPPVR